MKYSLPSSAAVLAPVALLAACSRPGALPSGGGDDLLARAPLVPIGGSTSGGALAPVHFIGRFDAHAPLGPRFAWPGSAIAARFTGRNLSIKLHDEGQNHFTVVVDAGPPAHLATSGAADTYLIAQGLAPGEHQVWIEKRTESHVGAVTFLGFEVDPGAQIVPSPPPFTRHVEIIGDSISCGYGDIGPGPGCGFSPDTEDESLAYGAVAARALSAAHTTIAVSGIGVYRNGEGSTVNQMPQLFERTLAEDAASTWDYSIKPDVVVVNLGTNDFGQGDPGPPYADALGAFVTTLRGRYPEAQVLLAVGSMLSDTYPPGLAARTKAVAYLKAVMFARHAAGDTRVSFVDLGVQDGEAQGYGCDWHPSAATHLIMAKKLTAAIRAVTAW